MSTTIERSESVDNTCPVCHDVIEIYAVGPCDHRVCYRCSTRMRVLCEQMDCPICRSHMPQVYKPTSFVSMYAYVGRVCVMQVVLVFHFLEVNYEILAYSSVHSSVYDSYFIFF